MTPALSKERAVEIFRDTVFQGDPARNAAIAFWRLPEELHAAMEQYHQEASSAPCEWTPDPQFENDTWDSACGEKWSFIDGGPEDNRVRFCHGCGKPVHVKALPDQIWLVASDAIASDG